MIQVIDEFGRIQATIEVDMNKDVLVTQSRAREIVLSLQELSAIGVLRYESKRVDAAAASSIVSKRG